MGTTPEQLAVIMHRGGHLLVPAVPGSGKTYAMVKRVYALLAEGIDPKRMLVLMFNVSARADFEDRLKANMPNGQLPEVLTFHAFGLRLCRALERTNQLPKFELVTKPWIVSKLAKAAIQSANEGLTDEDKITPDNANVDQLIEYIEFAKNEMLEFSRDSLPDIPASYIDAMKHFEQLRKENKLRTFTDLLYDPAKLIVDNDKIKAWVGNRYDEIIGDEAQDMNRLQIVIMSAAAGNRANVCIVGDEDQSIYEWRGSRPDYMVHHFVEEFPGATRLPLTRSFRYGHQIALMANHLITKNTERMDKLSVPGTEIVTKVDVFMHEAGQEGEKVAQAINQWRKTGGSLSDSVVLVREYSHSVLIETTFLDIGIPYKLVGASPFFMRKEALALKGMMLLAGNGLAKLDKDERREVLNAMLSMPATYLRSDVVETLLEIDFDSSEYFIEALRDLTIGKQIPNNTKKKVLERAYVWEKALARGNSSKAGDYLDYLITELDMQASIFNESSKKETALARWRTVQAIHEIAVNHDLTVEMMLEYLDDLRRRHEDMNVSDAVLITSVHRAKGLEWPHVIMPGLRDGSFPSFDEDEGCDQQTMEAERRLFFVGITRATKKLTLVAPIDARLTHDSQAGTHLQPENADFIASRFLYESNIQKSIEIGSEIERGAKNSLGNYLSSIPPIQSMIINRYLAEIRNM